MKSSIGRIRICELTGGGRVVARSNPPADSMLNWKVCELDRVASRLGYPGLHFIGRGLLRRQSRPGVGTTPRNRRLLISAEMIPLRRKSTELVDLNFVQLYTLLVVIFLVFALYKEVFNPAFTFFICTVALLLPGIITPVELLKGLSNQQIINHIPFGPCYCRHPPDLWIGDLRQALRPKAEAQGILATNDVYSVNGVCIFK